MRGNRTKWSVAGVGFLCLLSASCSTAGGFKPVPETGASLTGTVTYKHEPIRAGVVLVQGQTAGAQGRIGEDGRFTVENVPLGEVSVAVTLGPARDEIAGLAATQRAKGEKVSVPKIVAIPVKYANPATSPIKVTIRKGTNAFDIDLD